ncbi:MAG: AAA family ATPase [Candidatus Pacebacteria bacterium]|nr:AAA family ATPase [Candidatus Paceibacterota bacterium]
MLKSINFKAGRVAGGTEQVIPVSPITIIIGPNNSGKSTALYELPRIQFNQNKILMTNFDCLIDFESILFGQKNNFYSQKESFDGGAKRIILKSKNNEDIQWEVTYHPSVFDTQGMSDIMAAEKLMKSNGQLNNIINQQLKLLNSQERLTIISQQRIEILNNFPSSVFNKLHRDTAAYEKVREIIYTEFGNWPSLCFVIDNNANFELKFTSQKPPIDLEFLYKNDAQQFFKNAISISQMSDGVKSYTGMILSTYAGNEKLLLIDEPEAFLHPSLAQKLGKEFGKATKTELKQFICATHSPFFLMGCLQSGVEVTVIRLTYKEEVATARHLNSTDLKKLMTNPMLRSTGMLNGLFYENVVITEADSDRAFYEEINHRLVESGDPRGITNCLFLHVNGKTQIPQALKMMRDMGIPSAAIFDLDFIALDGSTRQESLEAANLPTIEKETISSKSTLLNNAFKVIPGNEKNKILKSKGIRALNSGEQEAANNLADSLQKYGIFLVRNGELESWLGSYKISDKKTAWLNAVFKRMGDDPNSESYQKPESGDVWDFIGNLKEWLENPKRLGMSE